MVKTSGKYHIIFFSDWNLRQLSLCFYKSYFSFEKLFFQKFNLTFQNWINPTISVLFIHSVAKVDLFQLNLLFTQPWLTIKKGWFKKYFHGIISLEFGNGNRANKITKVSNQWVARRPKNYTLSSLLFIQVGNNSIKHF